MLVGLKVQYPDLHERLVFLADSKGERGPKKSFGNVKSFHVMQTDLSWGIQCFACTDFHALARSIFCNILFGIFSNILF